MWFKNLQLFSLESTKKWDKTNLEEQLSTYAFSECLPRLFSSQGWVSPSNDDEYASLSLMAPGAFMLCCQFEEKILPNTVVQKELKAKIKELTAGQDKKTVSSIEKRDLKETITQNLLPRAFTKISRVYAYIDTRNNWLVINTTNKKRTEQLLPLIQRTLGETVRPFSHKKIAPLLTRWLQNNDAPEDFYIEKSCLLQDPQQENRLIRCREQNLFSESIQSLLKDGCEVKQLALSWKDQVQLKLTDELLLTQLRFSDELLAESKTMREEGAEFEFQADFVLMTGVLNPLLAQLIDALGAVPAETTSKDEEAITV